MISSAIQAWRESTSEQRAILHVRAAYTVADLVVMRYGAFAYIHDGGDVGGLVQAALLLSVAIAIGYSGGALFYRHIGLTTTRAVLAASFLANVMASAAFLLFSPGTAAWIFAAIHGMGHGTFYLGYFAHMLRHSSDAGRDKLLALTSAQGQLLTLVVPVIMAGAFLGLEAIGLATSPFLLASLCLVAAVGVCLSWRIGTDAMPQASLTRAVAMATDRAMRPMIWWAAALRVTMAEDTVLFAALSSTLVDASSEFGLVQLLISYIGFAASCRWTASASRSGRAGDMACAACWMAVTAWLTPLGATLGTACFVLAQAARNAAKPMWSSVSTSYEMHLGGDGSEMTTMVVRDTAVGLGRVAFLFVLAVIASVVSDPFALAVIGFLLLGLAHAFVGILTPVTFTDKSISADVEC